MPCYLAFFCCKQPVLGLGFDVTLLKLISYAESLRSWMIRQRSCMAPSKTVRAPVCACVCVCALVCMCVTQSLHTSHKSRVVHGGLYFQWMVGNTEQAVHRLLWI
jgi:hypothetical protein